MEKKTIPLWQDLLFWGTILSLLVREYDYRQDHYVLTAMAALFLIVSLAAGRQLFFGSFLRRYWYIAAVLILCLAYQGIRIGLTTRMFSRSIGMFVLIYAGFVYGKRFCGFLEKGFVRLAVFLGVTGVVGIVWWLLRICPLGFMSGLAIRYFLSAPERMVSVFSHPILAACYMLLLISITLFIWPAQRYTKLRLFLLLTGLVGLFATYTRSAYLVMLLSAILWLYVHKTRIRAGVNRKTVMITAMALLLILGVLFYTGVLSSVYLRFFGTDWREDRSYTLRIDSLRIIAGSVFARGIGRFLFGAGIGKGKQILNVAWFQEKYGKKLIDNTYLSAFADGGVFVAALMLSEAVYVLVCCFREKCLTLHGRLCCLLLPQLLMIAVFDVQGWCSLLFVVCILTGMELALREKETVQ